MALRAVAGAIMCLTATPAWADTITLETALARAVQRPGVAIAGSELEATRGEAAGARRSPYNPELGVAAGPRLGGGETLAVAEISLTQTFELGGKRPARRAAADARVSVAAAELAVATATARLEAWRTFQLALVARARLETHREAESLAIALEVATRDSQALGAGTQLRVNLATAEVGRARHDRLDAENVHVAALAELATAIGAAAREQVEPAGGLPEFADLPWTEDDFVARATRARPELGVARARIDAAQAEVRLADALGTPDLTLGVAYDFEQDLDYTSHAVVLSASIALPVRNRNQGAREAARARRRGVLIASDQLRTEVERDARVAFQSFRRAREAVLGFDREINDRLHENLELARESFRSGKLDYFEFNVMRRELIASRVAYLDAVAEAVEAWYAVQRALGAEGQP